MEMEFEKCFLTAIPTLWMLAPKGNNAPRELFPSIIGKSCHMGVIVGMAQKYVYDQEKISHHTFINKLWITPWWAPNYISRVEPQVLP